MINLFKTYERNKELLEENKTLIEENKNLKSQIECLSQFRQNFDKYYEEITGTKLIIKHDCDMITVTGVCNIDWEDLHYPVEEYKETIAREITEKILPLIDFDLIDNPIKWGTKDMIGKLKVISK
jgi:hypothetical protein